MSTTIKQAVEALKSRVADAYTAIVAKGGTLPATQDSASLPAAIASIRTDGGEKTEMPKEKDVCFYDYDGTLLYSYDVAEVLADDFVMPELPYSHDLLTFECWTMEIEELKQEAAIMEVVNIAQFLLRIFGISAPAAPCAAAALESLRIATPANPQGFGTFRYFDFPPATALHLPRERLP